MQQRIQIPKVNRDERIGSVFNGLFKVINATERAVGQTVQWDFDGTSFFHPFFLAPLAIYKEGAGKKILCENVSDYLGRYFGLIHFGNILNAGDENLKKALFPYTRKTYTPICKFSLRDDGTVDHVQSVFAEHYQAAEWLWGKGTYTSFVYAWRAGVQYEPTFKKRVRLSVLATVKEGQVH